MALSLASRQTRASEEIRRQVAKDKVETAHAEFEISRADKTTKAGIAGHAIASLSRS